MVPCQLLQEGWPWRQACDFMDILHKSNLLGKNNPFEVVEVRIGKAATASRRGTDIYIDSSSRTVTKASWGNIWCLPS